jgi:hypothetical protein
VSDAPFSKLQALSAVRDNRTLSKAEKLVLVMLISHASNVGECFPSLDLIAEECDMARSVVAAAVSTLRARGASSPVRVHATRRYRATGRGREPNVYTLELSPAGGPSKPRPKSGGRTQVGDVLSPEIARSKSEKVPVLSPAGGLEAGNEAVQEAGKGSAATSAAGTFTLEAPTSKAAKRAPAKKRSKAAKPASNGEAHKQVVDCYFAEWQAKYGGKSPIFRSREGKAVHDLLEVLNGDAAEACNRIRNAFSSWNWKGKTILAIAGNPDAFSAVSPKFESTRKTGPKQPNHQAFDATAYES